MMSRNSWLRSAVVMAIWMTAAGILAAPLAYPVTKTQTPNPAATPSPMPGFKTKIWNFDQDPAHQVASGWEAVSGDWLVLPDPAAPSKPNTFGLPPGRLFTSLIHGLGYYSIALLKDPTGYTDFTLEVELKPIKGSFDCSGGFVLRYVNPKNFYLLPVGCPSDYFRLIRVFQGKSEVVQQKIIATDQGTWYKIRIEVRGDRFVAYDDNKMVFDAVDSAIAAGRVGLWVANDSQARFDNFTLMVPAAASDSAGPETGAVPGASSAVTEVVAPK